MGKPGTRFRKKQHQNHPMFLLKRIQVKMQKGKGDVDWKTLVATAFLNLCVTSAAILLTAALA
ncbi:hypothetical protein [Emergencia sp.]|uniref:hypothetical protein n=1 Tax=Emergencia sp. TaxID=1926557 RepID=UPI003AF11FBF